jgi:hypothetical protein
VLYSAIWEIELIFKELMCRYGIDILPKSNTHALEGECPEITQNFLFAHFYIPHKGIVAQFFSILFP